jgi:hypothetical protein
MSSVAPLFYLGGFFEVPLWLVCGCSVASVWLLLLLCGFLCGSTVNPQG